MKKNLFLTLILAVSGCFAAYAQARTLTGTITSSDDGSALPGVSVMVSGNTDITVISDKILNCKYQIPNTKFQITNKFQFMKHSIYKQTNL
jgi:hypothetical protein